MTGRKPAKTSSSKPGANLDEQPSAPVKARAEGFPLVALGVGAGGLIALKKFFAQMPPDSGMGVIIVQHPDSSGKRLRPSTLGKLTAMEVHQAKNGMCVEPDRVYVIPPAKPLTLVNGAFQSVEHITAQEVRYPIDFFFKSLAEDRREAAIGVILSGTGGDGARGLQAINEAGGLTFVQDPEEAVYEGMPRRALATGVIDAVLAAGQIPGRLISYASNPDRHGEAVLAQDGPATLDFLQKIMLAIRRQTGHDFSQYKQSTVLRRIKRRMGVHQFTAPEQYLDYLRRFPQEATILFHELLIGVTSFFRDEETFAALKEHVIPDLLACRRGEEPLRVWVVGCSTGEEAYSLAMLITESKRESGRDVPVQIFASDIDAETITRARQCRYPKSIAENVGAERLRMFFKKEGEFYRVSKEIRSMVVFAVQNAAKDPPFSKMDLITCRNLMIYLEPQLQKKLLLLFHYSLNPGGFLLLGSAESVGELTHLYQPYNQLQKIFRRIDGPSPCWPLFSVSSSAGPASGPGTPGLRGRKKLK